MKVISILFNKRFQQNKEMEGIQSCQLEDFSAGHFKKILINELMETHLLRDVSPGSICLNRLKI